MSQSDLRPPSAPASSVRFPLYDDVVRLVINNLSASEMHFVVQLSKQWHRLVLTMPPLQLRIECTLLHTIQPHSAVRRHITEAFFLDYSLDTVPDLLSRLFVLLPNLRNLQLRTELGIQNIPPMGFQPAFQLPPLLEKINVSVHYEVLASFLTAVSTLPNVQMFQLTVVGTGEITMANLDFSPLVAAENILPALISIQLNLHVQHENKTIADEARMSLYPLPASLVTFLRGAGQLQELDIISQGLIVIPHAVTQLIIGGTDCPLLRNGNLKLIKQVERSTLDRLLLESLSQVRSLTSLQPWNTELQPADMQLLAKLPNLVDLRLSGFFDVDSGKEPYTVEAVIAAVKNAPQLTNFHLRQDNLTTGSLDQILACLPHLTQLSLSDCSKLTSLEPLSKYDLPNRLMKLAVIFCSKVPVEDVEKFIFPLQKLTYLKLSGFFPEGVPIELRKQLTIDSPTLRLPQLEECYLPFR